MGHYKIGRTSEKKTWPGEKKGKRKKESFYQQNSMNSAAVLNERGHRNKGEKGPGVVELYKRWEKQFSLHFENAGD